MQILSDDIDGFSLWLLANRRLSVLTVHSYTRDVRLWLSFMRRKDTDFSVRNLNLAAATLFLIDYAKNHAAASRARCAAALRCYVRYLAHTGIVENFATHIQVGGKPQLIDRIVPQEQMQLLVSYASDTLTMHDLPSKWTECIGAISFILLYATGMRVSELVSIQLYDVDRALSYIKVTGKRKKQRMLPLPDQARDSLRLFLQQRTLFIAQKGLLKIASCDSLLVVQRGGRLRAPSRITIWRAIKKQLHESGIFHARTGPHLLRHTLASHLLAQDWNLRIIQLLLGHEHITTVQRYTHTDIRGLQKSYNNAHPRVKK